MIKFLLKGVNHVQPKRVGANKIHGGIKMQITLDRLEAKGACSEGVEWFKANYPNGGDYQEILNKLASEKLDNWASWLLDVMGGTDDVVTFNGDLISEVSVFIAGSLVVNGSIKAGGFIKAWDSIEAGGFIKSGGSIKAGNFIKAGGFIDAVGFIEAGDSIKAGGSIEAGDFIEAGGSIKAEDFIKAGADYGIYAGIGLRLSSPAMVIAKSEPNNIVCGVYHAKQ